MVSADREAVRLALRLLPQSDGHTTETLCTMLGRLIRVDPSLFLAEVGAHSPVDDLLGCVVGNLGPAYVDRPAAQIYETRERIRALESARVESSPHDVRSRCIKALSKGLEFLEGVLDESP